ncbi:MAG: SipW-dependent-type signal peptide-containing protein [Clostridia bacterium]
MMKKYLKPMIALVLVASLAIGGTIAYLTDETDEVTNTFTTGTDVIDLTLAETTSDSFSINPAGSEAKDPTATLVTGSVDSYIYIDVIEYLPSGLLDADGDTATFADYVTYAVTSDWELIATVTDSSTGAITKTYVYTAGTNTPTVVSATESDKAIAILTDSITETETNLLGSVSYPATITNAMLTSLDNLDEEDDDITLSFVAYAVQAENLEATDANGQFASYFSKTLTIA